MQLILLGLILGVFLHDSPALGMHGAVPALQWPALLAVVLLPKLLLAGAYFGLCRWTLHRLAKARGTKAVRRLEYATELYRMLTIALYVVDLSVGALVAWRNLVGDFILIDELILMTPTLLMLAWTWWAYYPIDRRLREAALVGQLDRGQPVYAIWTRWEYLIAQVRHQMALILAPALLLLGWIEAVSRYGPVHVTGLAGDARSWLILFGALIIFLLVPLVIRYLWDTVPLPDGEMRQRLLAMCHRHRVGVRELLLWRTFGGMINAAVMGLIAPLRYILLTDALLEMLTRERVEAVMAHELAHIRRHHMFWLLAAAIGMLGVLELAFATLLINVQAALPGPESEPMVVQASMQTGLIMSSLAWLQSPQAVMIGAGVAAGACWIFAFGWVSRRVERQADTFAVQHLATQRDEPVRDTAGRVVIDAESAQTMIEALQQVAELNHIPPRKRSWRHGSIAWRQGYLRRLVGAPVDDAPIDRQMRWIKLAALLAVGIVVCMHALIPAGAASFTIGV